MATLLVNYDGIYLSWILAMPPS